MKLPEDGFDLAVVNGTIIRCGPPVLCTGEPPEYETGKIAANYKQPLEAREVIDARGRYVSPGFIDFHSHVDGKHMRRSALSGRAEPPRWEGRGA